MTKRKEKRIWDSSEVGCYADCSHGIYQGEIIIDIAKSEGWNRLSARFSNQDEHPDGEYYHDCVDAAEDFLNTYCAEEGYYFGSVEDGSWGYWQIYEEEN